jgi:hypothetical protein
MDVAPMTALRFSLSCAFLFVVAGAAPARADVPMDAAQQAELDRTRAQIANQVQLSAYDLVDELVYGWTKKPVFEAPTPVVLASVTVPVGLGTGLQALLENHIAEVLLANPSANITLVHCPTCSAVVVHSGPEGTMVSRGIDDPQALAKLGGTTGQKALFVDVEAEGAWLVLRARITDLTPELPIVWSHTLSTSAATPALLRQPQNLKSAADARQEYVDALHDRGPITVPLRFVIRTYAQPEDGGGLAPPPFLWLESGVELGATRSGAWTSSLLVGYSFIPQAYQGLLAQARINRLLSGKVRSLTRPDLYLFVGAAAITVWGPATAPFQDELVTADNLDEDYEGFRATFGTIQVGLDLRIAQRIGLSWFLESLPSLNDSNNLGTYVKVWLPFPSMGTEVTFCF